MPQDNLPIRKPELNALYTRIGGEKGLETLLDQFYQRMSKDTMIGFFFEGKDLHSIALQQKKFLMRAMGATQSYQGKPPAQAHRELSPILPGHFDRRLKILEEVLTEAGLSAEDMRTWIAFENTFREGIVASKNEVQSGD